MTKRIEIITGINNLQFTYGFGARYLTNGKLDPHYDNWNNTISCTICVRNLKEEWPIYIHKKRFNNPYSWRQTIKNIESIDKEDIEDIKLKPGDIGIFAGRYHMHWRNDTDNETDIILLHWVKKGTINFEKDRTEPDEVYDNYDNFLNSPCFVKNLTMTTNKNYFVNKKN